MKGIHKSLKILPMFEHHGAGIYIDKSVGPPGQHSKVIL